MFKILINKKVLDFFLKTGQFAYDNRCTRSSLAAILQLERMWPLRPLNIQLVCGPGAIQVLRPWPRGGIDDLLAPHHSGVEMREEHEVAEVEARRDL